MNIVTLSLFSVALVAIILVVKEIKPDFVIYITLAFSVVIFLYIAAPISKVVEAFTNIADKSGIKSEILTLVIKVVGISFIAEFASSICSDAGQTAIASKIESAAKIAILTMALPILTGTLETIFNALA